MTVMATTSEDPPTPRVTPALKAYKFVSKLQMPTGWKEDELRDRVLQRTIPTAVADAGASSNCGAAPLVSACGDYEIRYSPFRPTGRDSDRTFRDTSRGLNPATELRELPMDVRPPANLVHMVLSVQGQPAQHEQVC